MVTWFLFVTLLWTGFLRLTCRRKVGLVGPQFLDQYGDLLQGLHSLDLQAEAVQHGLPAAQQVGLQDHGHPLPEVRTAGHLAAHVPEEEVADPLALQWTRRQSG